MTDSKMLAAAEKSSTVDTLRSHRPGVRLAGAITAVAVAAMVAMSGVGSSHTHSATTGIASVAVAQHHLVLADDRGPTTPAGVSDPII